MKAILEFDLPEDEDLHQCHVQSVNLTLAVWTFLYDDLRSVIKYSDDDKKAEIYEEVRDKLIDRLEDHNVDIEVLP